MVTKVLEKPENLARGRSAKHPNLIASGGSANRTFCGRLERLRREMLHRRDMTHQRAQQRRKTRMI